MGMHNYIVTNMLIYNDLLILFFLIKEVLSYLIKTSTSILYLYRKFSKKTNTESTPHNKYKLYLYSNYKLDVYHDDVKFTEGYCIPGAYIWKATVNHIEIGIGVIYTDDVK